MDSGEKDQEVCGQKRKFKAAEPLTPKEKKLAEENCGLLFKFLSGKDHYTLGQIDAIYTAFFRAMKNYNPELGYAIATYTYTCMKRGAKRISGNAKYELSKRIHYHESYGKKSQTIDEFLSVLNHKRILGFLYTPRDVQRVLETLTQKEYYVIYYRFYEKKKLKELGKEFNVTKQRINQMINIILGKIKFRLENF